MSKPVQTLFIRQPRVFLVIAAALWLGLYKILEPLSHILVDALPVEPGSHLYDALQFFLYDTPKVLLLLAGVVMVMGMVNSWFTPERTRALPRTEEIETWLQQVASDGGLK